jgi:hypothetical protein
MVALRARSAKLPSQVARPTPSKTAVKNNERVNVVQRGGDVIEWAIVDGHYAPWTPLFSVKRRT